MFENIQLRAGKKAFEILSDGGFDPAMLNMVAAASGGPKFLVLTGIDKAVFPEWFLPQKNPIHFIGSSIGAWRGAALLAHNPTERINILEEAYLNQHYSLKPTASEVSAEASRIFDQYVTTTEINQILESKRYDFTVITSRPTLAGKSDNPFLLLSHLACSMSANLINRKLLNLFFKRTIFTTAGAEKLLMFKGFDTKTVPLNNENFKNAIMATGAIPVSMKGVVDNGTTYRDGGIIDYHLNLNYQKHDGICFYPHYKKDITPGWFDKALTWRRGGGKSASNVFLVAPSDSFVKKLPNGKIPDRNDFYRYKGNDRERIKDWQEVIKRSLVLGEELLEAVASGKIKDILKPL